MLANVEIVETLEMVGTVKSLEETSLIVDGFEIHQELMFIGIFLFVCISLYFLLNGFSLMMISRVKLQEAFRCRKKENLIDKFLERQESILLVCLFCGIVTNILAMSWLGLMFELEHWYLSIPLFLAIEMLWIFIPYSWAKYTGEGILAINSRALMFFLYVSKPLLWVFKLHDTFVMRLAGVTDSVPDQEERQEELLSVVEQGIIEGVVDQEEMEMIENVLELSDSTADEIMTPRTDLIAINVNESLEGVLEIISDAGHSRIPVYDNNIDNIIGLIYAKDLLAEIGKDLSGFKLRDKMRDAYFVPESKPLRDLLHEFQNQKLHIAVVLDEYGGTAGIVTIEDILEELVGEIVDEYEDTPQKEFKKIDETTVEIDARMHIDDLNEEFDLTLPEEEDYDTVGGFVFSYLGYIPKTGEVFEYEGLNITISAAETRRIKRIKIHKLS